MEKRKHLSHYKTLQSSAFLTEQKMNRIDLQHLIRFSENVPRKSMTLEMQTNDMEAISVSRHRKQNVKAVFKKF